MSRAGVWAALVCLAGVGISNAQSPMAATPPAPLPPMTAARGPSLDLAAEAAKTAIETCRKLGSKVAVSVVDSAGFLKLLMAADGTHARGVVSSTAKAVTALELNMPISDLYHQVQSDQALAEKVKAHPNYVVGQGGWPLRVGDELIGAIGVGGADGKPGQREAYPVIPGNDEQCARAAVEKIRSRLK